MMSRIWMNRRCLLIAGIAASLAGSLCATAYGQSKPKIVKVKPTPAKKDETKASAEPDKILYERASNAIKRSRYVEGRLDFQTLINTYPDSEYLAKAKLGVADSFYKEGGTSSLTQAIEEYKNFIVFFPFLDEAAYAQMQVGMAHYKMMEKADRDISHAEAAEDEFRAFLLKYPQSAYVPQAEQSLRNVQEVLADGEFGIAKFYYTKKDIHASAARLLEVTSRYPLYSRSDEALWMLGDIYERAKRAAKNEDQRNQFADVAAKCYDRIIQDHPESSLVSGAKARLKAMNMPIPAPDPNALKRMREQQLYEKQHHQLALVRRPMGMLKNGPDFSAAARSGAPNLNPPDEVVSATDVLQPGAAGPSFTVVSGGASTGGGDKASSADTESVETEPAVPSATSPATGASVQILDAPNGGTSVSASPTEPPAASPAQAPANPPADPAVPADTVNSTAPSAPPDASATAAAPGSTDAHSGTSTPQASQDATGANSEPQAQSAPDKSDPATESTSKKKKGLHKLNPF
jgi:outer membrane protein assembly factor BamD